MEQADEMTGAGLDIGEASFELQHGQPGRRKPRFEGFARRPVTVAGKGQRHLLDHRVVPDQQEAPRPAMRVRRIEIGLDPQRIERIRCFDRQFGGEMRPDGREGLLRPARRRAHHRIDQVAAPNEFGAKRQGIVTPAGIEWTLVVALPGRRPGRMGMAQKIEGAAARFGHAVC